MTTEVLGIDECRRLLRSQHVGRLAVITGRYPMVVPVNFAVDRGTIVFRTGTGTKLAASRHGNVAFEVDEVDLERRAGWSVLVTGTVDVLEDGHDASVSARSRALPIRPFDDDEPKGIWVRIVEHSISGRRISGKDLLAPEWGSEAYL